MSEHQEFVSGLRKLADWYERNHESMGADPCNVSLNLWAWTKESFAEMARLFGSSEKVSDETFYMHRKQLSPTIRIDLNAYHDAVCVKVKVGEEVIPAKVIPAVPEFVEPERVVEKFEWRCPESVLAPAEVVNA